MATKERIHQLIDELPDDDPDTDRRLEAAEHDLLPAANGDETGKEGSRRKDDAGPDDKGPVPTLEESIAKLASFDFRPREEAWR